MNKFDLRSHLPLCIICKSPFDHLDRIPITQTCNHLVCSVCLNANHSTGESIRCPLDNTVVVLDYKASNEPLLILLHGSEAMKIHYKPNEDESSPPMIKVKYFIRLLAHLIHDSPDSYSPQQARKLIQLIQSYLGNRRGQLVFIAKLESIYERMLFEVVQVHHSTRSRELAVTRMLDKKNCCIFSPIMTDDVIEILIKLYRAAAGDDGHKDRSFERSVLNKFLIKELGDQNKSIIEKILQTLLWCNCFDVVKMENAPSRYKLKANIRTAFQMREQHDNEIIRKVRDDQGNPIRLTPESWASVLHGQVSPRLVANMQSLLDKNRIPTTIEELESTMRTRNNRVDLRKYDIGHARKLEHYFSLQTETMSDGEIESLMCSILEEMAPWFPLLAIRSLRSR